MRVLKSSVVRQNISKLLAEVAAKNSVIGIESNGEVVAVLTAKAPQWEIGPIHLLAEDARALGRRDQFRGSEECGVLFLQTNGRQKDLSQARQQLP